MLLLILFVINMVWIIIRHLKGYASVTLPLFKLSSHSIELDTMCECCFTCEDNIEKLC